MHMLRLAMMVSVLLLLAAPSGTVLGQSSPDESGAFPLGTFIANDDPVTWVTFSEDGTCQWSTHEARYYYECTFATNDDLYTEMTFGPLVMPVTTPATYYWDWDGQTLSFELWGDETNSWRQRFYYTNHTYRLVPDAVEVVVAAKDAVAGYIVAPKIGIASASDAVDAFTDPWQVKGRIAAVDIVEGQAITPEVLVPLDE